MLDPHTIFNAKQQAAIRWMADNIDKESKKLWNKKTIIAATGMTEGDYQHFMHELNREKYEYVILLIGGTLGNDFAVMNGIHGLVRRLDQVPAKDYWKDVATWFRSKRWSVPVFILGVVFPAIAGYILVITAILKWFGWN